MLRILKKTLKMMIIPESYYRLNENVDSFFFLGNQILLSKIKLRDVLPR